MIGVAIACALWASQLNASLARTAYATGYAMYGAVVFLAAYQLRKKLPGFPLGTSKAWLQAHLVVAFASSVLFYLHIGGRWPNGAVEGTLAMLYAGAFVSGVIGFYLTRTIPKQLARTGEQFIFERIPRLRSVVQGDARAVVLEAVHATGATTLADFYADRLHGFFRRPRALRYTLRPTTKARKRLFNELNAVDRYLTEPERSAAEKLFGLVRRKDDLDFHAAKQGVLKAWLFAHISLTWALLLLGAGHGVMALAFRGGPTP
ncbi:hypothetical protein [Botrimarina mediterranea]|uniref:Iron reductase n=1 Tax=Botrimarina mediterranea TaxID=2528022 RepID=A0A518KDR0_9BACT|nr:hypothetical protein [Botrimarina mediterranea]QDV75931.1 hypothetical protein Spa11_41540 [Botrimarina mediterranea]QDV80526.1 hypothetical protein K2D_41550 [Planctomycetes bacterium K2D]